MSLLDEKSPGVYTALRQSQDKRGFGYGLHQSFAKADGGWGWGKMFKDLISIFSGARAEKKSHLDGVHDVRAKEITYVSLRLVFKQTNTYIVVDESQIFLMYKKKFIYTKREKLRIILLFWIGIEDTSVNSNVFFKTNRDERYKDTEI